MGNKAPSAANLDTWLKEHPGYEVVRSGGKVVIAKVCRVIFLKFLRFTMIKFYNVSQIMKLLEKHSVFESYHSV